MNYWPDMLPGKVVHEQGQLCRQTQTSGKGIKMRHLASAPKATGDPQSHCLFPVCQDFVASTQETTKASTDPSSSQAAARPPDRPCKVPDYNLVIYQSNATKRKLCFVPL